jgi:hypothetical protein
MARLVSWPLAAAALLACAQAPPPEPVWPITVEGAPRDVRSLVGEWRGEFLDQNTRHSGTILFRLLRDGVGQGNVTFVSPSPPPLCPDLMRPNAAVGETGRTVLRIARLAVGAGSIGGSLAPYRDEQRSCWVDTWFMGRLLGDRLEGSFFVHPAAGDTIRVGTWWATRAQ